MPSAIAYIRAVERTERRIALWRAKQEATFDRDLVVQESAVRGRTARRVRAQLRRLEPVAMVTPRWSAPQSFLEELALDLAVGEPGVGCRTVSFRPLLGRSTSEAWNFLLRVLADLAGTEGRIVPTVADRRGFLYVAEELLDEAHEESPYPVALLGHGCEHLPVEVLIDLAQLWTDYQGRVAGNRRCTMLLAGSVDTPALDVGGALRVVLTDFGEMEAEENLITQVRGSASLVSKASRFSGGVPALLQAIVNGAATTGLPSQPEDLLRVMGPVADELRSAVNSALTSPRTADRFYELLHGVPLLEDPAVDRELLMAGLLRRVRVKGDNLVELRSPAIAAAAM